MSDWLTPGSSFKERPKNAVFVSKHETLRHFLGKCLGAYQAHKWGDVKVSEEMISILKLLESVTNFSFQGWDTKDGKEFVTEAVHKDVPKRRVDLVILPETIIEFETSKPGVRDKEDD